MQLTKRGGVMGEASPEDNEADLRNELKLLCVGDYFVKDFMERSKSYNYNLVSRELFLCLLFLLGFTNELLHIGFKFLHEGSFVGKLETPRYPPPDVEATGPGLIHDVFLATPLLPFAGNIQVRKFSGWDTPGRNTDPLGETIDAFAHSVVVSSGGQWVLDDLQGLLS
jgi:hypothetical protein